MLIIPYALYNPNVMGKILIINKPLGKSPLQAIYKLKEELPEYKDQTISYAGRLDPMAEGLLLLLVGDENKKRNGYEDMEKEYEFEVFFGAVTDSYDILGLIAEYKNYDVKSIEEKTLRELQEFLGEQSQAFPPYSSKPVDGKPLYWWARENKLSEITIPEKSINIKEIKHLETNSITSKNLEKIISKRIELVEGDFRQKEIISGWENYFGNNNQEEFCVMRFSASVSSGTYIRSLAKKMGEKIGIPSLAFSIKRTRVGEYTLDGAIELD